MNGYLSDSFIITLTIEYVRYIGYEDKKGSEEEVEVVTSHRIEHIRHSWRCLHRDKRTAAATALLGVVGVVGGGGS